MGQNVVKGLQSLSESMVHFASGGAVQTETGDKLNKEMREGYDSLTGKAARDEADKATRDAQAFENEKQTAQLLYDKKKDEEKRNAAARARQKSLGGAGFGRGSTILTSPLGSVENQSPADKAAKSLLGS